MAHSLGECKRTCVADFLNPLVQWRPARKRGAGVMQETESESDFHVNENHAVRIRVDTDPGDTPIGTCAGDTPYLTATSHEFSSEAPHFRLDGPKSSAGSVSLDLAAEGCDVFCLRDMEPI